MNTQTIVVAQSLRLRTQPVLATFAPLLLPGGTPTELLPGAAPGWVQLRFQRDGHPCTGWCTEQMLNAARHAQMPDFPAAEIRMWDLVQQYSGKVSYQQGVKAAGLGATPPVIDCSGWVGLLLTSAMQAQNISAGQDVFDAADIAACNAWSDRIILEIEARTPVLLEGRDVTAATLPRSATIGLNIGNFAWAANNPRLRGINHIVQVVRRPTDQVPFVSESIGPPPDASADDKGGVRLTPLDDWLAGRRTFFQTGTAWAVDPFALASPVS